jgi:surface polysaccharide O-acyltransferase-like enzyme
VLLFTAGIAAGRYKWLAQLEFDKGLRWLFWCVPSGLVALLSLLVPRVLHRNGGLLTTGWHWQGAAFALWESFTCVALSFGLLVIYREKFDKQGPLARFLSANAFSVYVFHPPIVILIARLLHSLNLHPLSAFVILWVLSAVATFTLSAVLFRRIPLLQKVL